MAATQRSVERALRRIAAALALAAGLALASCGSGGPTPATSTHPASATTSATAADTAAACALVTRVARYIISPHTTPSGYQAEESLMRQQHWPPALAGRAHTVEADLLDAAAGSNPNSQALIKDTAALVVAYGSNLSG
jgi:hypothetical protein